MRTILKVFLKFVTILLLFLQFLFFGRPLDQGSNLHPCIKRQCLNHWTAREVPSCISYFFLCLSFFRSPAGSLFIYSRNKYLPSASSRPGVVPGMGTSVRKTDLAALGAAMPASFWIQPHLPAPCLQAAAHVLPPEPLCYDVLRVGIPDQLATARAGWTGFPSLGPRVRTGLGSCLPSPTPPVGCTLEPENPYSGLPLPVRFWCQEPHGSRHSQLFPLTLFYGVLLTRR